MQSKNWVRLASRQCQHMFHHKLSSSSEGFICLCVSFHQTLFIPKTLQLSLEDIKSHLKKKHQPTKTVPEPKNHHRIYKISYHTQVVGHPQVKSLWSHHDLCHCSLLPLSMLGSGMGMAVWVLWLVSWGQTPEAWALLQLSSPCPNTLCWVKLHSAVLSIGM